MKEREEFSRMLLNHLKALHNQLDQWDGNLDRPKQSVLEIMKLVSDFRHAKD